MAVLLGRVLMLGLIAVSLIVLMLLYDNIACQVSSNDSSSDNSDSIDNDLINDVKGYYAAVNGQYIRRGTAYVNHVPDFFELYSMHRDVSSSLSIVHDQSKWYLYHAYSKRSLYMNDNNTINHPPSTNWKLMTNSKISNLIVKDCRGSIVNSSPITSYENMSNIQIMFTQPITMILLFLIYYYAYYLYTNNVDVSTIAFSYDSIIGNKEYWRVFTAAVSHVDLLHLAFNTMTLYDIGNDKTTHIITTTITTTTILPPLLLLLLLQQQLLILLLLILLLLLRLLLLLLLLLLTLLLLMIIPL